MYRMHRLALVPLLALLILTACAPSPSTPTGQPGAASSRPAGQKTLTVAVNGAVEALSIMGSSTTSGGWQSLNELHSQGLVTADRDVQRPMPRIATQVPAFENGGIQLLPDGRM